MATKPHAGCMDHIKGLQVAAARHRGLTQLDRAEALALLLDPRPALAADRTRHARTQDQVIVGCIDDCVYGHLRNVALHDLNFGLHVRPTKALEARQMKILETTSWRTI